MGWIGRSGCTKWGPAGRAGAWRAPERGRAGGPLDNYLAPSRSRQRWTSPWPWPASGHGIF